MARCKTVTVDRDGTPVRMNESDFDPDKDTLWSDEKPDPSKMKVAELKKLAEQLGVEGFADMTKAELVAAIDSTNRSE